MENDNDTWAQKWALSLNDLLESSIGKLGRIMKDFLEEQNKNSDDGSDLLEVHNICYQLACKVGGWYERKYPTIVPWLPDDISQMNNMTVYRCKSPSSIVLTHSPPDLEVFKDYTEETLTKFIETPPIGSFVCVIYHKKMLRAFVLGILAYNRLKVLNIDTHDVFIISNTSIYHMPSEVCEMHALSVHCSMMEYDGVVEQLWSEDLEAIFSRTLQECSIKVEILKVVCESPPKYLVELYGTNSDGHTLSLTDWLHNILIPDMKQSFQLLTDKEELLYFLKDACIDPFIVPEISQGMNDMNLSNNMSKEQILSSLRSVPPPVEGLAGSCANSIIEQSVTHNEDTKEKLTSLLSSGKTPILSASHVSWDGDCLKSRESTGLSLKPEDLWTYSDQALLPKVRNRISLPNIGERANVVITHVLSSLSFYVVLEEKFSDVIDQSGTESYTTLVNRMNHPLSSMRYAPLPKYPSVGQLVAFRGKISNTWQRGVITQIRGGSVTVLNPDLGQSETILLKDLRTIADEDTILPFQAVLTFLHNIRIAENCADKAKDYFVNLISSKKLHVIVKAAYVNNAAMEVELFASNDLSINKALVTSNFCVQVHPSPTASSSTIQE